MKKLTTKQISEAIKTMSFNRRSMITVTNVLRYDDAKYVAIYEAAYVLLGTRTRSSDVRCALLHVAKDGTITVKNDMRA